MFVPKVIPDKVDCDLNEIIAKMLHSIAMNTPTTGIKIDKAPKDSATIAIAFMVFPFLWFYKCLTFCYGLESF